MKVLPLVFITIYVQTEVSCSFFNDLSDTLSEVSDKVKTAFTYLFQEQDENFCEDCDEKEMMLHNRKKGFVRRRLRITTTEEPETEYYEALNLTLDPSAYMSTPQLALIHGWNVDSHLVKTEDGYILTVHRIRRSVPGIFISNNQTVLLSHGLLGSSADWILLGPEKSLPYLLANLGYDVWLANARGNRYSRGHVTKNANSRDFWSFTWQDMGEYDLPAIVNFIKQFKNNNDPINFIGHSMGATSFLVMLSMVPQFNAHFRLGILLAPPAFMKTTNSPLKPVDNELDQLYLFVPNYARNMWRLIGNGEFRYNRIPKWFYQRYCNDVLCSNPLFFFCGPMRGQRDQGIITKILNHIPAGGSSDTIKHYVELIKSGRFHKYGNFFEYPLSRITLPIALFSSSDDVFASVNGVMRLHYKISRPIDHHVIRGQNISHTEFVWGSDADIYVFNKVIEYLKNGLKYNAAGENEVK